MDDQALVVTDRYDGRPMLRLLECFVLWSIDRLSESQARTLQQLTPNLSEVYEIEGTWQSIVASVLNLPEELPEQLRLLWQVHCRADEERHPDGDAIEITPQRWAEDVVDTWGMTN